MSLFLFLFLFHCSVVYLSFRCVFIELMTSRNFLPGPNEQQQLEVICKLCGTPNEDTFAGVSLLPNISMLDNVKVYNTLLC